MVTCCGVQELAQVAALLEEVVTILGPIRRDSEEGRTGHKVGTLTSRYYDKDPVLLATNFQAAMELKKLREKYDL